MPSPSTSRHRRASYSGGGPRVVAMDHSGRMSSSERREPSDRRSTGRAVIPGEVAPPVRQVSTPALNDDVSAISAMSRRHLKYHHRMNMDDDATVATAKELDALKEKTRQLEGIILLLSHRLAVAEEHPSSRQPPIVEPHVQDVSVEEGEVTTELSVESHKYQKDNIPKMPSHPSMLDCTVPSMESYSEPEAPIYNEPLPQGKGGPMTCIHRLWHSFAVFVTCFIPSCLIRRDSPGAKHAWRQKVAICLFVAFVSMFFVGCFGAAPLLLCRNRDVWTFEQMWKQEGEGWSVIWGTIYDMNPFISGHPGGSKEIVDFLGQDASKLFPRLPPSQLPKVCLNSEINMTNFDRVTCSEFTDLEELTLHCHMSLVGLQPVHEFFKEHEKGKLVYTKTELEGSDMNWIRIFDRVYDVTDYVESLKDKRTLKINVESENAYLDPVLTTMIVNKLNEDATGVYNTLFDVYDYIDCMDELFFVGSVDEHFDVTCYVIQHIMYGLMFFVAANLALQALFSMMYLARRQRQFKPEDARAHVMVMVPCYNEGKEVLKKTIDSILESKYTDENKVLAVVTDGIIKGKGESCTTPEYLSQLLGFNLNPNDHAHEYTSLGSKTTNCASVYFGTHTDTCEGKVRSLNYIVVIKRGMKSEAGSPRAGNRGKRDSQVIFQGFLNRIHNNREPCPLDVALCQALAHLGFSANLIDYLMCIDADTRIANDAMQHMVLSMEEDKNVLACCGETQVENKTASWVTMIQVFEYFSSHHLKKSFESVFGCVTCLPGCFTMYRLRTSEGGSLWAADDVIQPYSRNDIESLHDKNLYDLGEDRMLTTLLLQTFPAMKLSFVPEAECWTVVPDTCAILLSQRRRWINSTFHNQIELLKVKTMCGVFCFSMKLVVMLDLISTMILPVSLIQAGVFLCVTITDPHNADVLVIILFIAIITVQMLTFILRSRFDHFLWYLIFVVLGTPIFYFILPLYSFWNMDDFSWGATRQLAAAPNQEVAKKDASMEKEAGFTTTAAALVEELAAGVPNPKEACKAKKASHSDEANGSQGSRSVQVELEALEV